MDSYEYYLLYHKDSRSFINALTENNCEILIALKKLITNQKLKFDTEKSEVFQKVWNFMQNCETNEKLDEVLEALLTADRQETVKYWLSRQWACFDKNQPKNVLNVTAILVKKIVLDAYSTSYLLDISSHLIDILLVDSNHQTDALHILKFIIEKSLTIQAQILQNILKKCLGRSDILALQCLCNFFDKICEENIEINLNDFLLKFFQNSAPKQGIFIIKTLVHKKKLNAQDEESFKKFTIILEALEENQSHLILPSFSLLKTLKFTENFKSFWFILVQMILSHENSLIRNWGLNFVLDCSDYEFNDEEITSILSALNATYLFDDDLKPISLKHLQKFICRNWAKVFRSFEKIDWASVPCYNILKSTVVSFSDEYIDSDFVNILHKQIENIPKRVKNLVIRSGVQRFFEELTLETVKFLGITPMIPVLLNLESFESLKKCFQFMQPGEYDVIFNGKQPANFIKPALEVVADNTSLEEMIYICKNFKNREKLLIETYCKLNKYGELKRETELVMLIEQVQVNQNCVEINNENVKAIELGLKSLKTPKVLQEKVSKFMEELEVTLPFNLEAYFNLLKVMMELEFEIPSDVLENVEDKKFFHPVPPVLYCNLMMLQTASFNNSDYIYYLEHMKNTNDIKFACKAIKKLMESRNENLQIGFQYLTSALDNMLDQILRDDKRTEHVAELTRIFLMLAEIPRNPISNQRDFKDVATTYLSLLLEKLNVNDKAKVQNEIFKNAETTMIFDEKSNLRDWLKCLLVEKLIETDILTKEQQIEMMTSCEIEGKLGGTSIDLLTVNDKKMLRFKAATLLASKFKEEFPDIIENYMEDMAKASRKKPRYFPNSWIHRMKLHCLQPMVLCEDHLTPKTIEILVEEILRINNQLNVSILIEIILSRHYPAVVNVLKDEKLVSELKAPALKSILAIAVMQMRMEDSFTLLSEKFFGIAEMKLETIHDLIIPFTIGQNYSVRSYAQAAIIILFKHVKSLFGARESQVMIRIDRSCGVIKESMKFKNASRFIEVLKQDFRFLLKFDDIFTVDSFYFFIPVVSKMPAEEILVPGECISMNLRFKIAEMENETESHVMGDELAVPNVDKPDSTSISLQQKYLPYKYQVPGEKLMSTLPKIFENEDGQLQLRQKSNLIVVASLIDRSPNLGGLARTCEIFGTENYVIGSLKLTENSEFKALSKTAEKWLKISEVKSWQLFDFLLGMKQKGYSVVGAEQSGKSVSLDKVEIPKKSVLLLGNEKEGIPADLLSLLDIIIEIPQLGVIRSLNVHVTGAIVIWEYAKQHLIK